MSSPQQRAARKRELRVARKAVEAAWTDQVNRHLGFLCEQYGFALTKVSSSVWNTSVEYANATTTIAIDRSVEFNGVEARVQRKPDWFLPGQPIFITMNFTHEPISLSQLARLRLPGWFGSELL